MGCHQLFLNECHFQQNFSYIMAVGFIVLWSSSDYSPWVEGIWEQSVVGYQRWKPDNLEKNNDQYITDKLYNQRLYRLQLAMGVVMLGGGATVLFMNCCQYDDFRCCNHSYLLGILQKNIIPHSTIASINTSLYNCCPTYVSQH
jgi:hypothetical protein